MLSMIFKGQPSLSALGSASDSRRTAETGHYDFRGVGCQIHGPPSQAAIPNVENVPRQSCVPTLGLTARPAAGYARRAGSETARKSILVVGCRSLRSTADISVELQE